MSHQKAPESGAFWFQSIASLFTVMTVKLNRITNRGNFSEEKLAEVCIYRMRTLKSRLGQSLWSILCKQAYARFFIVIQHMDLV
jgi:hypothetical protein